MNQGKQRAAVQDAIRKAQVERSLWRADIETVLGFMEIIGVSADATRAQLTENYTGDSASLCLAPASHYLQADHHYAILGRSGDQDHLFVVVAMNRGSYETVRGHPPDKWELLLHPRPGE